ncbi:MAG: rhodanese-like domain-containing protein [Chloroflexia bacterium]|nr:rhodanese-like domain-containing protein [Chloroflexia bacterium]
MKKDLFKILIPVLIILALVIIKSSDKNSFALSANEIHELSLKQEHILSVEDYKNKSRTSKVLLQLVDIRSAADFEAGHLKGAINIPAETLLESAHFKGGNIVTKNILYSESIAKTCKAWTLLAQKGFENVYVLDLPKEFISQSLFDLDSIPSGNEELNYTFQPDTITRLE